MPEQKVLEVTQEQRLDQLLARVWPALTRDALKRMVREGAVLINDQAALKPGQRLQPGDRVVTEAPEIDESAADASPVIPTREVDIAYEDDVLIVVEKPAGVAVRPTRDVKRGTVMQQLVERFPERAHIGGFEHAGVLSRLEEDASGLVLVAKEKEAYREMRHLIKRQQMEMTYSVLVEGYLTGEYTIEKPIGNVKYKRRKLYVSRQGRPASTYYRAQRHYKVDGQSYSLLMIRPKTARMHQIRVHLSWYGFPIVGDRLYGSRRQTLLSDRLFMHLSVLEFTHPVSGEKILVESELPRSLSSILRFMSRPKR
ncbi:MAG: RluA family pseudouridine synthase [Anaerolineales bacterium]